MSPCVTRLLSILLLILSMLIGIHARAIITEAPKTSFSDQHLVLGVTRRIKRNDTSTEDAFTSTALMPTVDKLTTQANNTNKDDAYVTRSVESLPYNTTYIIGLPSKTAVTTENDTSTVSSRKSPNHVYLRPTKQVVLSNVNGTDATSTVAYTSEDGNNTLIVPMSMNESKDFVQITAKDGSFTKYNNKSTKYGIQEVSTTSQLKHSKLESLPAISGSTIAQSDNISSETKNITAFHEATEKTIELSTRKNSTGSVNDLNKKNQTTIYPLPSVKVMEIIEKKPHEKELINTLSSEISTEISHNTPQVQGSNETLSFEVRAEISNKTSHEKELINTLSSEVSTKILVNTTELNEKELNKTLSSEVRMRILDKTPRENDSNTTSKESERLSVTPHETKPKTSETNVRHLDKRPHQKESKTSSSEISLRILDKTPSKNDNHTFSTRSTSIPDKSTEYEAMIRSGTWQGSASSELAFTTTEIPSIDKIFSNEFKSYSKKTTDTYFSKLLGMDTDPSQDVKRIDVVESKRGGFFDLNPKEESTAETTVCSDCNGSINFYNAKENDEENTEKTQSQHIENKEKHLIYESPEIILDANSTPRYASEERLSVQPINTGKSKYTVNSNYKPLKKIDIQPSKQFLRDPDDNSWRNKSLSSLGIVFKANNSSKTFTEVLKNKTETILNNIQENDEIEDEPELRVRLEKITEKRKSKKKLFGDYWESVESSSEEIITTTPNSRDMNSFMNSLAKTSLNTVSEPTIDSLTPKEVEIAVNNTSKSKLYDFDDDDDNDGVTYPIINLKKDFQSEGKIEDNDLTTPAYESLNFFRTLQFPERKASVQYFPPQSKSQFAKTTDIDDYQYDKKLYKTTTKSIFQRTTPDPDDSTPDEFDHRDKYPEGKSTISVNPMPIHRVVQTTDQQIPSTVAGLNNDNVDYDSASNVIKNLKDFLNEAKQSNDESSVVTKHPMYGVTAHSDAAKANGVKPSDYFDYESLRKEVIDKFEVNKLNNIPMLYNTSIVHGALPDVALSQSFLKRQYENGPIVVTANFPMNRAVDELLSENESYYYTPEDEQKLTMIPKIPMLPPYALEVVEDYRRRQKKEMALRPY